MKISSGRLSLVVLALLLCGAASFRPAYADVASDVATFMEEESKSKSSEALDETRKKAPREVLLELGKYLKSDERKTRLTALWMISGTGKMQKDRVARRIATQLIFKSAVGDVDSSLAGTATDLLLGFTAADFSDDMRQTLYNYMAQNRAEGKSISSVATLAGVMEVPSAIGMLRELAASPQESSWGAVKALARMGDAASIQQVVARTESLEDVPGTLESLRDLVFIRQPQAVEALVRVLFSEGTYGNGGDVPTTRYAQRAVDFLAQLVEGFPIEPLGTSSSKEQLEIARQWIIAQGGTGKLKIKR